MNLYTPAQTHSDKLNAPLDARLQIPSWVHFTQQTKTGLRGYGHCPAEAFSQTALALMAVITDPRHIQARETFVLECRTPDPEKLLLDWLNSLSCEMTSRNMLCCAVDVHINGHHLYSTLWGEVFDPLRHELALNPQELGYSEARVESLDENCWLAQCIVDV